MGDLTHWKDAVSVRGILFILGGESLLGLGRKIGEECRLLQAAVTVDNLAELEELLQTGQIQLPCPIAVRRGYAESNHPLNSMKGFPAIALQTAKYTEYLDASQPVFKRERRTALRSNADHSAAQSWHLSDDTRALSVAPFRSREARGFAAPWTDVEEIADQTQRPKGHLFETMLSLITRSGVPVGSGTRQLVFRSGSRVSVVGFLTTKSPNSTSFSVPRHAGVRQMKTPVRAPNDRTSEVLAVVANADLDKPFKHLSRKLPVMVAHNLEDLRENTAFKKAVVTIAGAGMQVYGLYQVINTAWQFYKRIRYVRRSRQRERQARIERAERAAAEQSGSAASEGNGDGIANEDECMICMTRKRNAAFPCGHVVACFLCATRCNGCPVCRRRGDPLELFNA